LTAFVAPIPASRIADVSEVFAAAKNEILQPKTGPFRVSECYEYEGQVVDITVVGAVTLRDGQYVAEYEQNITITDRRVIDSEVTHRRQVLPVLSTDSRQPEERTFALALDDYGTFDYFMWHDIVMLASGSEKQYIAYQHPDNYYRYHPQLWNLDWSEEVCTHNGYAMIHLSHSRVNQAIDRNKIDTIIATIVAGAVEIYGIIVSLALLVAKAIAAALVIILLYYALVKYWLENVVQAEQGDGWAYTYWNGWFLQISYGAWRDLWTIVI
jgi:hypothetical protein